VAGVFGRWIKFLEIARGEIIAPRVNRGLGFRGAAMTKWRLDNRFLDRKLTGRPVIK
jgi:hypothetical protein